MGVSRAPGWTLLRLVSWICSPKTVKRVFLPAIRDMQYEHTEALAEGRLWKAQWVLVRGYCSVWSALVAQAPLSLAKRLYDLWRAAS